MQLSKCHVASLVAVACLVTAAAAQRPKTGYWKNRKDIPEGWVVHKTRHYQVQSQAGMDKAKRLGAHMEAMFKLYFKMFRPDRAQFARYPIKLFKNREEFRYYGAPAGAGAYYSPVDKEMVCYDTGKWMDEELAPITGEDGRPNARAVLQRYNMDILGAAAHEGWHQYFHWYVVSWVQLPSWVNEGMGDYFYCARPIKKKGSRKRIAELGRPNEMRLPVIWRAVKDGKHVPVKRLLSMSKREYYANGSICYAEGWALCHFLMHSDKKEYRRIVPHFIRLVRDDTNMPEVTKRAFRGVDLDQLDEEFRAWVLGDGIAMLKPEKAAAGAGGEPRR